KSIDLTISKDTFLNKSINLTISEDENSIDKSFNLTNSKENILR
ncbi:35439_t:CDS:1, partial [Gigaspora margarita]